MLWYSDLLGFQIYFSVTFITYWQLCNWVSQWTFKLKFNHPSTHSSVATLTRLHTVTPHSIAYVAIQVVHMSRIIKGLMLVLLFPNWLCSTRHERKRLFSYMICIFPCCQILPEFSLSMHNYYQDFTMVHLLHWKYTWIRKIPKLAIHEQHCTNPALMANPQRDSNSLHYYHTLCWWAKKLVCYKMPKLAIHERYCTNPALVANLWRHFISLQIFTMHYVDGQRGWCITT